MSHPILSERRELCALFLDLGPDAPTCCEGWRTRHLAAHLWAREHRPDVGPGLVLGGVFGRHTARVEAKVAERPYEQLVADLRAGAPVQWPGRWAPSFDTHEWFVHHEDVRRANGSGPRDDLGDLDDELWKALGRWGRQLTRKLDIGVTLETPDGRSREARSGAPVATLVGAPGELLLFLFGRAGQVEVRGDAAATAAIAAANFGI